MEVVSCRSGESSRSFEKMRGGAGGLLFGMCRQGLDVQDPRQTRRRADLVAYKFRAHCMQTARAATPKLTRVALIIRDSTLSCHALFLMHSWYLVLENVTMV